MNNEIFDNIEITARKIAKKYSIIDQNKLQHIEIDEDEVYSLIAEFFEYNLSEMDVDFAEIKELMNKSFAYFYDKGIEAAISKHFNLSSELVYSQDDLIALAEPDLPQSITLYINNIALLEISNTLYDYVIKYKNEFEEQGYIISDITEKILLTAFQFGAELATQIVLKSSDFDVDIHINKDLKVDALFSNSDMNVIVCPFCEHEVYRAPKEQEFRQLAKINNCQHISLQFFEGRDSSFLMSDSFRQTLTDASSEFLTAKGDKYVMSLNNFLEKPEYGLDDFLMDLYFTKKITEADELLFLNILSEISANYDLKVSMCEINGSICINYFMAEKTF